MPIKRAGNKKEPSLVRATALSSALLSAGKNGLDILYHLPAGL